MGCLVIGKLIDLALENRFIVILTSLLLVVVGFWAMTVLPVEDAVPDVTNVQVQVMTTAQALGPEETERFITFPVETAIGGIRKSKKYAPFREFGLSVVTVVFEEGTDIYWARQQVGERLQSARKYPRWHSRSQNGTDCHRAGRNLSVRGSLETGVQTFAYGTPRGIRLADCLSVAQRSGGDRYQHQRRRTAGL
jgi:hypothetical protein